VFDASRSCGSASAPEVGAASPAALVAVKDLPDEAKVRRHRPHFPRERSTDLALDERPPSAVASPHVPEPHGVYARPPR